MASSPAGGGGADGGGAGSAPCTGTSLPRRTRGSSVQRHGSDVLSRPRAWVMRRLRMQSYSDAESAWAVATTGELVYRFSPTTCLSTTTAPRLLRDRAEAFDDHG